MLVLIRRFAAAGCTLALALAPALALSGCSISSPSATGSKGYVAGDGAVVLIPAGQRKEAPDLAGPLLGGGQASLGTDKGKVVVLNLWGSWCGPCRAEAPNLAAAARMLPAVRFMGINTKDVAANAEAFVRVQKIPFPSFSDQDGSLVLELQRVVNMSSLPITVVLDKEGRVAAAVYGPTTATTLKDITQPLERES